MLSRGHNGRSRCANRRLWSDEFDWKLDSELFAVLEIFDMIWLIRLGKRGRLTVWQSVTIGNL